MNSKIHTRVCEEAVHIINTKDTIRKTAQKFHVSKSTVHKDLTERLSHINMQLYESILKILKEHIETRHIKGGESTRIKYLKAS
ncbi:sporulation transcriptional regulator SpoIIID [Clostridium sp. CAG:1193]|nr:sporulation transcriptional regulator SpoIIID [Clostridium sp. CAG:1193]